MRRRISRRSPLRVGSPRARASFARGRMLERGPRGRYRRGWPENDAHRLRAAPLRGDRHRGRPRGAPRRRRLRYRRRHLRAPLARGAHQRRDRARRAVAASELPRRTRPRGPPAPGDDPRRRGRAGRRGGAGHGQARPDPRGDRAGRAAHAERGGLEAALTRPRAGPLQVNIAILGGTGKEGAGLARRWALAGHSIIIGSRDRERAKAKAAELREITRKMPIMGESNMEAAKLGAVVVLALPASGLAATLPEVSDACRDKVVISTVVALAFGGPRLYTPPPAGSSAEEAQGLLPGAKVVAAFHHIAAHELAETDHPIECDLLLCGDDQAAKDTVAEFGRSMGLRPIDVGPLSNAGLLEGITAVLATINRRYKLKNSGIKITGL